jgi:2-polyprenyl-3-methyl-5-hydroxy-6-metoxy-1,4-benzoquinol methylase
MEDSKATAADHIIDLYERHAALWSATRSRDAGLERAWLARFTSGLLPGALVLDLGCGNGWPIAAALLQQGLNVVGVDSSPSLIDAASRSFPDSQWYAHDMRTFEYQHRFDAIVAWHSLFHLSLDDQEKIFPRFSELLSPGGRLMFTTGPSRGIVIGEWGGEPLYHASFDPAEYSTLLRDNGFDILDNKLDDPDCGGASVWLATRQV